MTKFPNFWWDEMVTIMCLQNFLFGTEIRVSKKNHEGWMVGGWDGHSWDPSHRFRTWSHQNPTRRFCTKQPKAVPNKLPVKTWCEVYDDLAPRYPSYEEHHDRDRTTDLLIPQNDTNCQRLLKSVTTATIGSGIHFSSRRTVFHREREMDCF